MKTRFADLLGIDLPIVQAPMAGISTPALAAAVGEAGGLGSIALGASTAEQAAEAMAAVRAATGRPFAANVFAHAAPRPDPDADAAWLARLRPYFAEFGAEPPAALRVIYRSFDDDPDMLAALLQAKPPVVSVHFGPPGAAAAAAIKGYGGRLLASATTVEEALACERAGADAVVAQGFEAGGHRGTFGPADEEIGTLALVPQVVDAVSIPVVAAGGIADGRGIAAALALGAEAVQLGTAYVACPEAATPQAYRELLADPRSRHTAVTAAISGRRARTVVNRFARELGPAEGEAPDYPIAYDAGKALAAAASRAGSADFAAMWAGQHVVRGRALPAGELTLRLMDEALSAMRRLGEAAGS
jgi:nitronate monooxygenase